MLARRADRSPRPVTPEIPSLALAGAEHQHRWGGLVFYVIGSGGAGGLELRAGDLLVVEERAGTGDLVVLAPARYGRPLLGRLGPRGAVTEPSGVPCSAERWRVAGRVLVQVRPVPRDMPAVLRLPQPGAVGDEAGVQASLHIELSAPMSAEVEALLRRRVPGAQVLGERVVVAQGGGLLVQAPMDWIETLAAELWLRFRVAARLAVAPRPEQAAALLRRLPRGGLAVQRGEGRVGASQPSEAAETTEEVRRQLGLWGA